MEPTYPGRRASQVGTQFVRNYYRALQHKSYLVDKFYTHASTRVQVDGVRSDTASTLQGIHDLVMSLLLSEIKLKTVKSLDSWCGSVLVMVSGTVKVKDLKRTFVETFLLAPKEVNDFFVLNDILELNDEGIVYEQPHAPISSESTHLQHPAPISSEDIHENRLDPSSSLPVPSVSDDVLEEEVRNYINLAHFEDDPDEYSLREQQQHKDFASEVVVENSPSEETEVVVENSPTEESATMFQGAANAMPDPPAASLEEPVQEPTKKTYASVV